MSAEKGPPYSHSEDTDDEDFDEENAPIGSRRRLPSKRQESPRASQPVEKVTPAPTRKRRSGWGDDLPVKSLSVEQSAHIDKPRSEADSHPNAGDATSNRGAPEGAESSRAGPTAQAGAESSPDITGFTMAANEAMAASAAYAALMTAEQAMKTSRLHILAQQMGLTADQIKASRELYVGNLPPSLEVTHLVEFLNAAMLALKGNMLPGPPCVRGWKATEGHFAFIEFRTIEEANNGLALNGINCLGYSLRIGRPKTYPEQLGGVQAAQQGTLPSSSGVTNGILTGVSLGVTVNKDLLGAAFSEAASRMSGTIITSVGSITPPPDALCLRDLPPPDTFSEDRARELLTAFGSLKFFLYFGLPSASMIEDKLQEYEAKADLTDDLGYFKIVCKSESEVTTATAAPPVDENEKIDHDKEVDKSKPRLCEAFVDDLLSQQLERSLCIFEYHNPLDSQNLTDVVTTLRIAGKRPTLCAAEIPLSEEVIISLIVDRLVYRKCEEALKASSLPLMVPTRCLFFTNLLQPEELSNDSEYADILDAVKLECRKSGRVISMEIPRPLPGTDPLGASEGKWPNDRTGEGYAFVEFATVEEACQARKSLNGRKFSGRPVRADFLSESRYAKRDFSLPTFNFEREHSSMYNSDLATHVPAMLRQMEEIEKAGRDAARAAATAAANASFTGGALDMPPALTHISAALLDVQKPSFDEDVVRDEEAMEEDDD